MIDGDSLAHRAYHAMPKTVRLGCVVGFTNMLVRLWQAEEPRAVLVGWDSLFQPTYRTEAFEAYQSGRVFDDALVEQLDMLPPLVEAAGFGAAKAVGYEADDFLAAAVASEEARGGTALVATSDRDAFQLASERTTILQPVRGVSELARIGPDEVRERYGVDPEQVPDFIALRGDPSDKLPGAAGVGPKKAADVLREYGSLEAALAAGRFSAEAEDLRLYRRIAALDASAPLPVPRRPISLVGRGVLSGSRLGPERAGRPPGKVGLMDAWLTDARNRIAAAAGIAPEELELSDDDVRELLDLARIAAHDSGERTNAPLLCYLVGRARSGTDLETLADAVRSST